MHDRNLSSRRGAKRRVGRPAGEQGDLRGRLIDAAIRQFTLKGILGTSLRGIAGEAGVTPAMLHYYFGDKDALVQALVEERLVPTMTGIGQRLQQAAESPDPLAPVIAFVHGMRDTVAAHPWLPGLWVREVLCEGGQLRKILFGHLLNGLPGQMAQAFAKAQAQGAISATLDPRLLVVSLVGLTLFPAAGAPVWKQVFDAGDITISSMLDHSLALLRGGLAGPVDGDTPCA